MKTTTDKLFNEETIDHAFAVGTVQGLWFGIGITVTLLLLGAATPVVWRWAFPSKTTATAADVQHVVVQRPFELSTIYRNVPFIPLSDAAVRYSLNNERSRKVIERDMVSRWYFEQEELRGGTRYIPRLRDPGDVHSAIALTNGPMKEVVVQLVNRDGSPGHYGLIPFDDYQDDLGSLGK